jgi:hypothetical protein
VLKARSGATIAVDLAAGCRRLNLHLLVLVVATVPPLEHGFS